MQFILISSSYFSSSALSLLSTSDSIASLFLKAILMIFWKAVLWLSLTFSYSCWTSSCRLNLRINLSMYDKTFCGDWFCCRHRLIKKLLNSSLLTSLLLSRSSIMKSLSGENCPLMEFLTFWCSSSRVINPLPSSSIWAKNESMRVERARLNWSSLIDSSVLLRYKTIL